MQSHHSALRAGFAILLTACTLFGFATPQWASAQGTPSPDTSATPSTSTTIDGLPDGPLGTQIQWLVDYLNMPAGDAATVDLTAVFTPEVLAQVPADQMQQILAQIRGEIGPVHVKPGSILTTRDLPATTARFVLVGKDGIELPTSLSIDRDSGLINGIFFENPVMPAAASAASPVASPEASPAASPESGLMLPQGALGQQIQWLLDTVNGTAPITEADIAARFTPEVLAETSAADIIARIELVRASAPVSVKDNLIITTMDYPPSTSGFVLQAANGSEFQAGITIDIESGLIRGFTIDPLFVGA
ncbi:MAG: Cpe/LpqF family protein [Thermomicrobiales bacterium]